MSLRARALQYLARREYSRAELRGKLMQYMEAGAEPEQGITADPYALLDGLLDELVERGWLSDERAVSQLLHAKRNRFGLQRITHELRQRGIAEDLIGAALPQLKQTELDAAHQVWQRKFGALPLDAKEKARQMRFLQSRGFTLEVIFQLLRQAADSGDGTV